MRAFALCVALVCVFAADAFAGGGPETTLVVVNADSPLSCYVADRYVRLRGIHPTHVCRLRGIPNLRVIEYEQFRERILTPVLAFIEAQGLSEEIDLIAYSADLPFGASYGKRAKGENLPQVIGKPPVASLTGLTFFAQHVRDDKLDFLNLKGNGYFRVHALGSVPMPGDTVHPAHGFRHAWHFETDKARPDKSPPEDGVRYYLSVALAVTGLQGNSLPEIERYLTDAAGSDFTHPDGTVYFMNNANAKDPRIGPRRGWFDQTIDALEKQGRKGAVLMKGEDKQDGQCPVDRADVIGLVAGTASFNWEKCGSKILPGAITEHLTSFGGRFDGSGQTKISVFLRHGAAGSSGAVAEPYNVLNKHVVPHIHAWYAEGSSLAEAFYQSIYGPYQQIVVGDPLARPFAYLARISLTTPSIKAPWKGEMPVMVNVDIDEAHRPASIELWIDGQYVMEGAPGEPLTLDTTTFDDGAHRLRVVAVENSLVGTRSSKVFDIEIQNGAQRRLTFKKLKSAPTLGEDVKLSGKVSKGAEVRLRRGADDLGLAKVRGTSWSVTLRADELGLGTSSVVARATFKEGPATVSAPFEILVDAPGEAQKKKSSSRRKKKDPPKSQGKAGLLAKATAGGQTKEFVVSLVGRVKDKGFAKTLRENVKGKIESIVLTGEVNAPEDGLYRFAVNAAGRLKLTVKDIELFDRSELAWDRQTYGVMRLKAGWHKLAIEYEPTGNGDLSILFGGQTVTTFLQGKAIRHR